MEDKWVKTYQFGLPVSILRILGVECYSTPNYYTEQKVQYSRFSIIQYFMVLDVLLDDTERCSVLLSIFSTQF